MTSSFGRPRVPILEKTRLRTPTSTPVIRHQFPPPSPIARLPIRRRSTGRTRLRQPRWNRRRRHRRRYRQCPSVDLPPSHHRPCPNRRRPLPSHRRPLPNRRRPHPNRRRQSLNRLRPPPLPRCRSADPRQRRPNHPRPPCRSADPHHHRRSPRPNHPRLNMFRPQPRRRRPRRPNHLRHNTFRPQPRRRRPRRPNQLRHNRYSPRPPCRSADLRPHQSLRRLGRWASAGLRKPRRRQPNRRLPLRLTPAAPGVTAIATRPKTTAKHPPCPSHCPSAPGRPQQRRPAPHPIPHSRGYDKASRASPPPPRRRPMPRAVAVPGGKLRRAPPLPQLNPPPRSPHHQPHRQPRSQPQTQRPKNPPNWCRNEVGVVGSTHSRGSTSVCRATRSTSWTCAHVPADDRGVPIRSGCWA